MPDRIACRAADGHTFELRVVKPGQAIGGLFWLPALGVSARQYDTFADAMAAAGVACAVFEYRGIGSSSLRASRRCDWAYHELLSLDLPAAVDGLPALPDALRWQIGGHSLGGQLALLAAALEPDRFRAARLVASGSPYWRSFPAPQRYGLRLAQGLIGTLARLLGYYPGRRLGFAGNEARGLMLDWVRSGIHGVYRPSGMREDLEAGLSRLALEVLSVRLDADAWVPEGSERFLLDKLGACEIRRVLLKSEHFERGPADHFHWMREPAPVVAALRSRGPG